MNFNLIEKCKNLVILRGCYCFIFIFKPKIHRFGIEIKDYLELLDGARDNFFEKIRLFWHYVILKNV